MVNSSTTFAIVLPRRQEKVPDRQAWGNRDRIPIEMLPVQFCRHAVYSQKKNGTF